MAFDDRVSFTIELDSSQFTPAVQAAIAALQNLGKLGADAGKAGAQGLAGITTALATVAPSASPATKVINDLRASLGELGKRAAAITGDFSKTGPALSAPFAELDARIKRLGESYQNTGLIGQRSIAGLGAALTQLQLAHGKNIDAAQDLSRAEKQVFADAKATYADMIGKQRAFNDELEKVNRATHNFTSLEGAFQSLGGTIGKITTVTVGVAAALRTGWEMGKKFDEVLSHLPSYKRSWDELAESVFGYSQKVKQAAEFTDDPRFKGTRTVELLPKIIARQARSREGFNIDTELKGLGVQTFADAEKAVKAYEHTLELLRDKGGQDIAAFVQSSKSQLEDLAQAYRLRGEEIPKSIADGLKKLQGADAGVIFAKMNAAAVNSSQEIQNSFAETQKFIESIEVRFRAPETNEFMAAIQKVRDTTAAALQESGERANKLSQDMADAQAKAAETAAEIGKLKATGQAGPSYDAELASLGQVYSLTLQRVEADKRELALILAQRDAIPGLGANLEKLTLSDRLAKQLEESRTQIQAIDLEFNKFIEDATRGFSGGGSTGIGAGLAVALKDIQAQMDAALEAAKLQGPGLPFDIDPKTAAIIKAHWADVGRDLVAETKTVASDIARAFDDKVSTIFANVKPGGFGDALQQVEAEFQAMAEEMVRRNPFKTSISDAIDQLQPRLNAAYSEAAKKSAAAFQQALHDFGQNFADLFTAGLEGGAGGFAEAAARQFLSLVHDGASKVGELIGKTISAFAFGTPYKREDFTAGPLGQAQFDRAQAKSNQQQAAIVGTLNGVISSIGETMKIFAEAKKGQAPSVLGTTLSFAAAGASIGSLIPVIGTIIGAAIGAIAGAIIGLVASAKAKAAQPYAAYGIEGGVAYVRPFPGKEKNFANVTAQQYNSMIAQMQTTLESTQNDYIKLLLKFPNAIAAAVNISAANFAPTMDKWTNKVTSMWNLFKMALVGGLYDPTGGGGGIFGGHPFKEHLPTQATGDIGDPRYDKKAQKNFAQDFQNWVDNTLPKQIIASFEAPLAEGFATLGLTAEKFHLIWERLQAINPKDAIKSLNELFDALTAFKKVQEAWDPSQFGITVGLLTKAQQDMFRSFADQLAQADIALVSMGASLEMLIGPEQITAAKAWGDALLQREQAVKQFFQQVAQAIDQVISSYQSRIRDLQLEGMKTPEGAPDVAAQVNFLQNYANQLWNQITKATTPEQVLQLSSELQTTIDKIRQVGGSQGAQAAEAYRQWAIAQFQKAQDLVVAQLNKMAREVAEQNAAFLDAIQGFIDAFLSATDQLTGGTGAEVPNPVPPPTDDQPGHRWELVDTGGPPRGTQPPRIPEPTPPIGVPNETGGGGHGYRDPVMESVYTAPLPPPVAPTPVAPLPILPTPVVHPILPAPFVPPLVAPAPVTETRFRSPEVVYLSPPPTVPAPIVPAPIVQTPRLPEIVYSPPQIVQAQAIPPIVQAPAPALRGPDPLSGASLNDLFRTQEQVFRKIAEATLHVPSQPEQWRQPQAPPAPSGMAETRSRSPEVVYLPPPIGQPQAPPMFVSTPLAGGGVTSPQELQNWVRQLSEEQRSNGRIEALLERMNQILAEGRDIRIDVDSRVEGNVNLQIEDTVIPVPLDDGGFDAREINSRGRRG